MPNDLNLPSIKDNRLHMTEPDFTAVIQPMVFASWKSGQDQFPIWI